MITAIFGAAGSGKSVYAENELANAGGKVVYVGTLPRSSFFADKLSTHSARRPSAWALFELTESWAEQGESFRDALMSSDIGLIEGLSFYVYRQSALAQFGIREESELLMCLQELHTHKGRFFVVDPPIPATLPIQDRRRLRVFQENVVMLADVTIWVECGYGAVVHDDKLRHLLGIGAEEEVL